CGRGGGAGAAARRWPLRPGRARSGRAGPGSRSAASTPRARPAGTAPRRARTEPRRAHTPPRPPATPGPPASPFHPDLADADPEVELEAAVAAVLGGGVDPVGDPVLLLAQHLDLAPPGAGPHPQRDPVGDLDDQLADPDPGLDRGGPWRDLELPEVEQEVAGAQLVAGQLGWVAGRSVRSP